MAKRSVNSFTVAKLQDIATWVSVVDDMRLNIAQPLEYGLR